MAKVQITVVLPPRGRDKLSNSLRNLTKRLHEAGIADAGGYGLGGEYSYGANFENSTFLLHRFCWCEKEDCLWCSGDCGCQAAGPPEHYVDDLLVSADEQWAWSEALVGPFPHEIAKHGTKKYDEAAAEFDKRIQERNRRWQTIYPAINHHCLPRGLMPDLPERKEDKEEFWRAPNFWHKPSGFKVWWYKWIGRDMVVLNQPKGVSLRAVLTECTKSLILREATDHRGGEGCDS